MISVSSVSTLFAGCQRIFDHICPVCGEEIYHTFNGLEGAERIDFYTMCECSEKKYEQEAIEKLKENKKRIIEINKSRCGFAIRDKNEAGIAFKVHGGNREAYDRLINYANNFSKETKTGFYLYGPVGVGKSLLAKKVMTIVLNRAYSAYITNVSKLMNDIKKELSTYSRETFDYCISVDLLVIDDIGVEKATEYDVEQLFLILESRWREYKPIIFTSNHNLDELTSKYKDKGRLYSRINGTCFSYFIDGPDNRKVKEEVSI
jgi:DNA replication protein